MSNTSSVSALVVRWQELCQEGQDISAEELCADCPELLADVKRQIQGLASMNRFLGTSSSEAPNNSSAPTPDRGLAPKRTKPSPGNSAPPLRARQHRPGHVIARCGCTLKADWERSSWPWTKSFLGKWP